ncbi:MAG: aminotransferase class V-fold PLP-dependent enzyme [Actinobacteria bacterium]|nr:aminotransferase class V-fold PLP-dependent enzyme [Actinomycetota bacterium]
MLPQAQDRWLEVSSLVGNPSSLHDSGRRTRRIVEEARESIAEDLVTRPSAVIFTGGGTESDNLAVKGLFWRGQELGKVGVVASSIEHHAVLDPVKWIGEHQGAKVLWVGVDAVGRINLDEVEAALALQDVALVTVMWANNEVGTVQPVYELAALCRAHGVAFHTDAVQVLGQLPMNLTELGASAVTITAHKVGGPFGVGALILDPDIKPTPVLHGGGHEREIRSGTLDAAGIASFAVAVRSAVEHQAQFAVRVKALRNDLISRVLASVPAAKLNGEPVLDADRRLPANAHFTFDDCEGDALLMLLDAAGIDCSTGSACTAGIPEPSHVLLAMGAEPQASRGSLRFSLGADSTTEEIDHLIEVLPAAVERASRAGHVRSRS